MDVPPLLPEFVEAPGGEGAAVADGSVEKHLLELGNRGGSQNQIMLFRVRVGAGGYQARGEVNMLLLMGEAVGNPYRPEAGHAGGDQARFLPQFSARQFLGIDAGRFPSTLGQLKAALLHGIAELLDEIDSVALDGQYDGAVVLVHHAVDAVNAVTALDLVFAHTEPGIAIHFAATQGPDAHAYQCIAFSTFAVGKPKVVNRRPSISQPLLASDDQDSRTEDPESPEETDPYNFADAKLHVPGACITSLDSPQERGFRVTESFGKPGLGPAYQGIEILA